MKVTLNTRREKIAFLKGLMSGNRSLVELRTTQPQTDLSFLTNDELYQAIGVSRKVLNHGVKSLTDSDRAVIAAINEKLNTQLIEM